MSENLLVGTHKSSNQNQRKNHDAIFGNPYHFDICFNCSMHKANGGKGSCHCSLIKTFDKMNAEG